MTRSTRFFGIAAVGLLVALLAACGSNTPATSDTSTPTPTPSEKTFDETEWTIETPNGWTREVITDKADAKKAIRYSGPNGEYFIVAIDPLGSDFAYDALWRYEVKGNGFEIVDRYECKGKNDESCREDDNRYDGYILWKSGAEPQKVGGHTWYFVFGNATSTTVDLTEFEEIVEGIEVKA